MKVVSFWKTQKDINNDIKCIKEYIAGINADDMHRNIFDTDDG